ncbi:hypothetical protein PR202_ga19975 [Eleusine coracana subsp. coracana]|uniref:KIB1-4 beta-propeller domain-containing protein n=1 Tax=Eleusine coracana subsp. coracana TaxID=191504 RepID=A0AAV5CXU1_ELECO|nr:hypothetical protein QOZ80_4AG0313860 [Eleusine coracana subsp. coracana]GJN02605.1 hypothetical protein PR202_ga19975 [Eleusine coracana subsp. coracana]
MPAPMAPPPRTWAELPTDILTSVVDRLHTLRNYLAVRGVCTAWRSTLPPEAEPPCLIVAGGGVLHHSPSSAFSFPFRLLTLPKYTRCVGACHGWVAIVYDKPGPARSDTRRPPIRDGNRRRPLAAYFLLDNIRFGNSEQQQPATTGHQKSYLYRNFQGVQVSEVQVVQNHGNPKPGMALLNPLTGRRIELPEHEKLDAWKVDKVVFAPNPRKDDFTVVAAFGFNSLAYVSTRDDDAVDGPCWSFGNLPGQTVLADMVYREEEDGEDKVYCLGRSGGDVHVLRVPRGRPSTNPTIEPLLPELAGIDRVNPAYLFPPPHDTVSGLLTGASAKSLAFCGGDMYQVWRNNIGGVFRFRLPGPGGLFSVRKDEVFVLRFDPSRRPCWRVAGDLRGYAVFIGPRNSAAAVRAEDVPGVKGDCVYWIGRFENKMANVYDMRTKTSSRCLPPFADVGAPVGWCSLGLGDTAGSGNDEETIQRQPKRPRIAEPETGQQMEEILQRQPKRPRIAESEPGQQMDATVVRGT